jgi:transposase
MNTAWFLGKVAAPEAFPTKGHLKSYLGLAPREHDSAGKMKSSHLTRQGSAEVRAALHMAARTAIDHNPEMGARYDRLIARGKSHSRAMVHMMAYLLVRMWKAPTNPEEHPGETRAGSCADRREVQNEERKG